VHRSEVVHRKPAPRVGGRAVCGGDESGSVIPDNRESADGGGNIGGAGATRSRSKAVEGHSAERRGRVCRPGERKRAISRTPLVKGPEYDHVIVADVGEHA